MLKRAVWMRWARICLLVVVLLLLLSVWLVPAYGLQITYLSRPLGSPTSSLSLFDIEQQRTSVLVESSGLKSFVWSPDGRYLLLTIGVSVELDEGLSRSYDQLHVYEVAARRQWLLVEDAFAYGAASWSPDSRRVVYTRASESGVGVFTIDLAAADERLITVTETYPWYPVWSPDGSQIAFTDYFDNLYVVSAQGGEAQSLGHALGSLPCGRRFLAWSADSEELIYCREDTLYITGVDEAVEQVLAVRLNSAPDVLAPRSSAAVRIAFTGKDPIPRAVEVLSVPDGVTASYSLTTADMLLNPRWSSDGRFLLVTSVTGRLEPYEPVDLYRLDVITGEWTLLDSVIVEQRAWRPLSPDATLR